MSFRAFQQVFFLSVSLLGCAEEKKESEPSDEEDTQEEAVSAYGSCSLELVTASGTTFSASTIGASSVVIHLAYLDDDHGDQREEHSLQKQENGATSSISWSLDLDWVSNPSEVVSGQSTMWGSVFTAGDRIFVALNEKEEVCDCWDTDNSERYAIDCTTYGAE